MNNSLGHDQRVGELDLRVVGGLRARGVDQQSEGAEGGKGCVKGGSTATNTRQTPRRTPHETRVTSTHCTHACTTRSAQSKHAVSTRAPHALAHGKRAGKENSRKKQDTKPHRQGEQREGTVGVAMHPSGFQAILPTTIELVAMHTLQFAAVEVLPANGPNPACSRHDGQLPDPAVREQVG